MVVMVEENMCGSEAEGARGRGAMRSWYLMWPLPLISSVSHLSVSTVHVVLGLCVMYDVMNNTNVEDGDQKTISFS
jgi:hypothetical protein